MIILKLNKPAKHLMLLYVYFSSLMHQKTIEDMFCTRFFSALLD
jgi:hypothetical protein